MLVIPYHIPYHALSSFSLSCFRSSPSWYKLLHFVLVFVSRGGGFSLCGKFDRDNSQSLHFLQPGFARRRPSASGDLSALQSLLALNGNSLLSHV
jgi:hypothetical protein